MTNQVIMVAPAAAAGVTVKCDLTGNSYTSNANGYITANVNDINALENSGFIPLATKPIVPLTLSSAAGQYLVAGAMNTVPVSTLAAVANIAAPTYIGQQTDISALSTGNVTITSSGCTIYTSTGGACTTLTCSQGTLSMIATGSTQLQILARSLLTSSAGPVYGIASS